MRWWYRSWDGAGLVDGIDTNYRYFLKVEMLLRRPPTEPEDRSVRCRRRWERGDTRFMRW
jgi:hypothetical protein